MAEVINLRRARKQKARQQAEKTAEANRVQHGLPKHARDLAKARSLQEKRDLDARRLNDDDDKRG